MKINGKLKAEVTVALNRYAQAYSKKDIGLIMKLTAPDYFGFGSGPDEDVGSVEELRSHLERDFAQSDDLKMEIGVARICASGNVAWTTGPCMITASIGGKNYSYEGRMSTVLVKEDDKWLVASSHFAMPDCGQETGRSFNIK